MDIAFAKYLLSLPWRNLLLWLLALGACFLFMGMRYTQRPDPWADQPIYTNAFGVLGICLLSAVLAASLVLGFISLLVKIFHKP